jgi:hypothetical protein
MIFYLGDKTVPEEKGEDDDEGLELASGLF